jgi:DNA-binding MarR family transcriptional regulator
MAGRPEPPELLGCTCKRLRMATRRISQIYDQHLEAAGLTVTQYSLLAQLNGLDGIGIGAFAERLVMDPTTLTRNLRPLQRRGLMVFAPDPDDRRSRTLHLTAKGRAALERGRPLWAEAQRQIEHAFGHADTAQLHAALERLVERLGA